MAVKAQDLGLLALRLGVGASVAAHGAQKLFGWFGGGGLGGTAKFMESTGFRPGDRNALLAGLSEVGGGTLLALGLSTAPAGAVVAGTMVVAASTSVNKGFFNMGGGFELPGFYAWVASSLALTGPGALSLDEATRHALNRPWMRVLGFVAALSSAAFLISGRQLEPQPGSDA